MITLSSTGDFKNIEKFLSSIKKDRQESILKTAGARGVQALSAATPQESGTTARSWSYEVVMDRSGSRVIWSNNHEVDGVNIAVILQYGHGTGTGGYVAGREYINPAIRPVMDALVEDVWKEIQNA